VYDAKDRLIVCKHALKSKAAEFLGNETDLPETQEGLYMLLNGRFGKSYSQLLWEYDNVK
jgi:hypothetical protein